jgi:hypothetical protein
MYVRNLTGDEFPLQATLTHDMELNGNRTLSSTIKSNKVNDAFINDLTQMWEIVDDEDVAHKIVYFKKKGEGNRLFVDIKAIPLFFDKFDSDRVYETYNQHMTAAACFGIIFAGTNFNFVLVDQFPAIQWEGFGKGDTKLTLFKNALNRYGAEFRISGNTVYLESLIGRDTNFMYRHKLNASNIIMETDASQLWTYAKGFGDYEDGDEENAALVREYTSPLASIPGIGIRHAPPIYDGRVKIAEPMDNALKTLVDESLKISVSADLHDLRRQGYALAQPELGDRTFLIDERINLNEEVRVISTSTTKDWRGNVLDLKVVFGSEGISKRHQSNLKDAVQKITDLVAGNIKLPYNVLDEAVLAATKALQSAQTELVFENGIIARAKDNPNYLVLLNSAGIGISTDGGTTFSEAITYLGVNTSLLTAGQINANNIAVRGGNETDYSLIDANGFFAKGTAFSVQRPDGYTSIQDGILRNSLAIQWSEPPFQTLGVEKYGQFYRTNANNRLENIQRGVFKHDSRYIRVICNLYADGGVEYGNVANAAFDVLTDDETTSIASGIVTETRWSSNQGFRKDILIDCGVPTGQLLVVYWRMWSSVSPYHTYGSTRYIVQEG